MDLIIHHKFEIFTFFSGKKKHKKIYKNDPEEKKAFLDYNAK